MNPLQRASRNRKIIYFAVIAALFTVSMMWRGLIPVPLGTSTASAAQPMRWTANHTIQSQAERLEVWELDPNESEAELSGSALRLTLTGSRGFAVTALWLSAIEKQKRNDFHEFEQRVQWVTKLQPNFITPWIFQSWNITYNVSVEMHGSGDMYFYIARGIELLAEGERRNKRSPDMRYQIAFYYQNKFGVSDQVETLRCLFDLSCIPPSERNPKNLLKPGTNEVDLEAFKKFCQRHPHLVRRLRGEDQRSNDPRAGEKLRAATPGEVVQFLKTNWEVPCRYKRTTDGQLTDELADAEKQFPVLPPKFNQGPDEAWPGISTTDDFAPVVGHFTGFKAARAWFSYSLVLLPPNPVGTDGKPIPGPTPRPSMTPDDGGYDPFKYRIPRLPMLIIFRQGAPRAQSYQAELEQKEGWFDGEGWRIDSPRDDVARWWFPDVAAARRGDPQPQNVVVGDGRKWSLIEWEKARDLWAAHGKAYGLDLGDRLARLEDEAGNPNTLPPDPTAEQLADPNFRRRYLATSAMYFYRVNRQVTNFQYFLASAEAEAKPETVAARKTLWRADQARKIGDSQRAIRLYKQGLIQWKEVLKKNQTFHRSEHTEEETYEYELSYLRLLVEHDQRVFARANLIARATHAVVPFLPEPYPDLTPLWPNANRQELKWYVVENIGDADFSSPFVGPLAPDGFAWVRDDIKEQVKVKQGVSRRKPQAPPPPPGPNGPGVQPLPSPPPPGR